MHLLQSFSKIPKITQVNATVEEKDEAGLSANISRLQGKLQTFLAVSDYFYYSLSEFNATHAISFFFFKIPLELIRNKRA